MDKKSYSLLCLIRTKLISMSSDIKKWNLEGLTSEEKRRVFTLTSQVRGTLLKVDSLSTQDIIMMKKSDVKECNKQTRKLLREWQSCRDFIHSERVVVEKTNNFAILGIEPTKDEVEIKRAYKVKAKELHPDNSLTGSEEAFVDLKRAYDEIINSL